ncbi:nuclear transport factor 2 family protein [Brevibacterium daeguense]|nr:nuclear transport factor 2 family protein [Brevibacterium daeguense]
MSVLDELLRLEHAGWQSLCDGTGSDFYGNLMVAGGVMILAHGFVFDRQAVLESLSDAPPWSSYAIEDARVIGLSADAAVLVYRGTARRDDGSPPFEALMASTYVRAGGGWGLACYQQTVVPG